MRVKEKKPVLSVRISEILINIVNKLSFDTKLTRTDIVELSIVEFIGNFSEELNYEGIDFKEYAKAVKREKLRNIVKKQRNEFMSAHLFMNRVRLDILKLLSYKKRINPAKVKNIKNTIVTYLELRKKEAMHYKESKMLFNEFDLLEKNLEENLKSVKTYIDDKIDESSTIKEMIKY